MQRSLNNENEDMYSYAQSIEKTNYFARIIKEEEFNKTELMVKMFL